MILADLTHKRREELVRVALDAVLRKLPGPTPTAEVVNLAADILGTKETTIVAQVIDRAIKPTSPHCRKTGETFTRYGRTFHRWEWLPTAKGHKPKGGEVVERSAEPAAAAPVEDDWTVRPEPEFLEEQ